MDGTKLRPSFLCKTSYLLVFVQVTKVALYK